MPTSAIARLKSTKRMATAVAMVWEKAVAKIMESPIRATVAQKMVEVKNVAEMTTKRTVLIGRSVRQTVMAETIVADYIVGKSTKVLARTLCMLLALLRIFHVPIELRF